MYLQKLPAPGETIGSGRFESNLGGKGANQAVACLRAGAGTEFISCLGDDNSGDQIKQQFELMGLSLESISVIENCATGTACVFVDEAGENCIGLTSGANAELSAERVRQYQSFIKDAAVLLMQLETPIDSILTAAAIASEAGTYTILNPAPAAKLPSELLSLIDLITPNLGELESLTDTQLTTDSEIVDAARELIAKGVGKVIVTLGRKGSVLVEESSHCLYSPYSVKAVDSTAAGDCFNGYLAAAMAKHGEENIDLAIKTAMAAAAISVTRQGAVASIPELAEVTHFMQTNWTA